MSAQTRAPLHAAHRRVDRDQHQQPARHRRRRATYQGPSSNPRARRHRPSAHPARNGSEQRESMAAELCLARYVLLRSFTSLFLHPICTPFFFQTIVVSTLLIHSSFSYTKSHPLDTKCGPGSGNVQFWCSKIFARPVPGRPGKADICLTLDMIDRMEANG